MTTMKPAKSMALIIRRNRGVLAFLLFMAMFRTGFADWSYVPSGSMEPTLYAGDYVWIDKTAFGPTVPFLNTRLASWGAPRRGDVVTFVPPHRDELFVKRIVAIPGDRVSIRGQEIFINGQRLPVAFDRSTVPTIGETRSGNRTHLVQLSGTGTQPVIPNEFVVPEARYFVLGDHRDNSADSRFWGYVEEDRIMGRVTHVGWSFARQRRMSERIARRIR